MSSKRILYWLVASQNCKKDLWTLLNQGLLEVQNGGVPLEIIQLEIRSQPTAVPVPSLCSQLIMGQANTPMGDHLELQVLLARLIPLGCFEQIECCLIQAPHRFQYVVLLSVIYKRYKKYKWKTRLGSQSFICLELSNYSVINEQEDGSGT